MSELVAVERRRGIDRVWLASPGNRNALSLGLMDELVATVRASADDPDSRGLVLDHEGPVFCAGVDVKERAALPPGSRNHSEVLAGLYHELWLYPKPFVCRVAGAVRGGGVGIVVCADVVVATARASFAFSEVRIGVAPALVGALAMAKLGPGPLAPWLLTGSPFGPAEAAAAGLVTQVVGAGDVGDGGGDDAGIAEVEAVADAIAEAAPGAVRTTKQLLRRFVPADVPALLEEMTALSAALFDSDEAAEGMAAFAAKRPPSWVPTA